MLRRTRLSFLLRVQMFRTWNLHFLAAGPSFGIHHIQQELESYSHTGTIRYRFCSPSVRFGPLIFSTQDSGSSMLVGPKAEAWRHLQETSGNISFNTPKNLKTKSPGGEWTSPVFPVGVLFGFNFATSNFWPGASNCRHAGCQLDGPLGLWIFHSGDSQPWWHFPAMGLNGDKEERTIMG